MVSGFLQDLKTWCKSCQFSRLLPRALYYLEVSADEHELIIQTKKIIQKEQQLLQLQQIKPISTGLYVNTIDGGFQCMFHFYPISSPTTKHKDLS